MRPQKVIFDPHEQLFKMWYSTVTTSVMVKDGKIQFTVDVEQADGALEFAIDL